MAMSYVLIIESNTAQDDRNAFNQKYNGFCCFYIFDIIYK